MIHPHGVRPVNFRVQTAVDLSSLHSLRRSCPCPHTTRLASGLPPVVLGSNRTLLVDVQIGPHTGHSEYRILSEEDHDATPLN